MFFVIADLLYDCISSESAIASDRWRAAHAAYILRVSIKLNSYIVRCRIYHLNYFSSWALTEGGILQPKLPVHPFFRISFVVTLMLPLCAIAQPVSAQEALRDAPAEKSLPGTGFGIAKDEPIVLSADDVGYDTTNRKVIAKGKVEISQGATVLLAHQVEYDETSGVVVASGDVSVLEASGNVYFADQVTLKDEMQRGVISYFKGRLADGSLFTARQGERVSESVTNLLNAVYSPCAITCKDGSAKKPTWAITADTVNIDTEKEEVTYDDVWVKVYGQKMLYTPYLAHPTPGASNKSGFLSPTMQRDANLGVAVETPYLYVIDQSRDLTVAPMFISRDAPVLKGEYRQKWDQGELLMRGSFTIPQDRSNTGALIDGRTYRGHVDGRGLYQIDDDWQTGFTLKRTTDDTYLSRYKINRSDSLLTSRAYVEGINPLNNGNDRHYFVSQGLYFQGLTALDNRLRTPIVLPLTEFGYQTEPMWAGSRFSVDSSMMALTRESGADSKRLATRFNWNLPYTTSGGHMFALDTSLRADGYRTSDLTLSSGRTFNGNRARFVPEISGSWRYPLIRKFEESNVMLEPVANITATSNNGNNERISNEDNVLPEFNDLNLFSARRFSGWDPLETGTRMFYGFRTLWDFFNNKTLGASLGQAYRFDNDPVFPVSNDLRSRFSDYVGQFSAQYEPVNISYRYRLDKESLQFRRNEIESQFNFNRFGFYGNYLKLNEDPFLGSREEVSVGSYVRLNDVWTLNANTRRDLELSRLTDAGIGLAFQNECTTLLFGVSRNLINDRDIRESTTGYVQLLLKNLE